VVWRQGLAGNVGTLPERSPISPPMNRR